MERPFSNRRVNLFKFMLIILRKIQGGGEASRILPVLRFIFKKIKWNNLRANQTLHFKKQWPISLQLFKSVPARSPLSHAYWSIFVEPRSYKWRQNALRFFEILWRILSEILSGRFQVRQWKTPRVKNTCPCALLKKKILFHSRCLEITQQSNSKHHKLKAAVLFFQQSSNFHFSV